MYDTRIYRKFLRNPKMKWSLMICALIGLTSSCHAAPTDSSTATQSFLESGNLETTTSSSSSSSSSSLSSARTLPNHEVGLPSELAWQAWLVLASKPDLTQSSFESATVPRRISPKSVFIAPWIKNLPPCSDGYKADNRGRCIKDTIKIDPQIHLQFVINRLNGKFPGVVVLDDSAATGPELKKSAVSGPLQVNISLELDDNRPESRWPSSSEKPDRKEDSDDSVEISVVQVPPENAALKSDKLPTTKTEAELTLYEVGNKNDTSGKEKENTFFRGNPSEFTQDSTIREVVVPVAEFVDDGNKKKFTEVIDYEIPISLKNLFNSSSRGDEISKPADPVKNQTKNITETKPTDDTRLPTVVLLLSPTTLTTAASNLNIEEQQKNYHSSGTAGDHILVRTGNLAVKSTGKETLPVNIGGTNSPKSVYTVDKEDEVKLIDEDIEDTTLSDISESISTTIYPDEDPEVETELNDEILAHGEAGMIISEGNFGLSIGRNVSKGPTTSTPAENGLSKNITDDETSKISSEASIRDDMIVETTLLDLNTEVITGATPIHETLDDFRELFESEKELSLEPEVVFSSQDVRRLDRQNTRDTKLSEDSGTTKTSHVEKFRPSAPSLIRIESLVDSLTAESNNPEKTMERYISPIKEKNNFNEENSSKQRTSSSQDYVRFPENQRQTSSSYVIFPSDNSNSINGYHDYREQSSSYTNERVLPPQIVTNNNVPVSQKNTYWRVPPGWRIDDLQPPPQPVAVQNNNQYKNPMLLRFWSRMPLFRDPSITMNRPSRVSPIVTQRGGSNYRGITTQTMNQVFSQKNHGSDPAQKIG